MEHNVAQHLLIGTPDSATVNNGTINSATLKVQHQIVKHYNSATLTLQ